MVNFMKKVLLTCAFVLTILSSTVCAVSNIYAEDNTDSKQESVVESNKENEEQTSEDINDSDKPISYMESIKQLPEDNQKFIQHMIELYSDYNFVFNVLDSGLTAKDFESSLGGGGVSPEQYQSIINETLGEYAYETDYNEDEVYKEIQSGVPIKEHIYEMLKEAIEDHQADKVYMMIQLKDIKGASEGTNMLDTLTYYYANEANMIQILLSQLSKNNKEVQANYYKEVSKELGIELTADTDISTLDEKTIDKIYASEAFKRTTDPKTNPDANLQKDLSLAKTPEEWEESLKRIYDASYPSELTGKELNSLHNAINRMRMTRVYYYDVIHSVRDGANNGDESEETIEKTEESKEGFKQ